MQSNHLIATLCVPLSSHCRQLVRVVRVVILLFPVGSQCTGNTTESRACAFDSNFIPGEMSALLERLMKSLSISRTKRNTVLTQNFVEEKNLPVFIQRVQVYSVELMLLNLVSS